jgi:muconolactone delta-isomerase
MEFLVEFDVHIPRATPDAEIDDRERAEAVAAGGLAREGHLVRLWRRPAATGATTTVGLYRADDQAQLEALLDALPFAGWMDVTITPLTGHPNDPATTSDMPEPHLTRVYRLDATLGQSIDLGETAGGRRRIVPLTGGTFTGPEISGTLVPGASADWQTVLPDGTALGDIRYTLQTDSGAVLFVQSHSVRHGSPDVLARLSRGEHVDPSEYTFRTATQIQTGAADLAWMNKGVFISVGGRQPSGVVYETYLVG